MEMQRMETSLDSGVGSSLESDLDTVRVSRKPLEKLLEDPERARRFFSDIEDETGAVVTYPDMLGPYGTSGTRSRKDPYVKIQGGLQSREAARDIILQRLKNPDQGERLSVKMDVSFCDHSFIIGKKGNNIQNVMNSTNCHIHFPDSNQNHASEKSNQVSISGPPDGVKAARTKIRELLPISIIFFIYPPELVSEVMHPEVMQKLCEMQNEYSLSISVLPMAQLRTAMITVRGCRRNIVRIKEGLRALQHFLMRRVVQVSLGIEISPQHVSFVQGPNQRNIIDLMIETKTEISFPDLTSQNSSQMPTVWIGGMVDDVYTAWIRFMDLLPLALIIDLPDTQVPNTALGFNAILERYNITVITRHKARGTNQRMAVIRGPEKYVDVMFATYKCLGSENAAGELKAQLSGLPPPSIHSITGGCLSSVRDPTASWLSQHSLDPHTGSDGQHTRPYVKDTGTSPTWGSLGYNGLLAPVGFSDRKYPPLCDRQIFRENSPASEYPSGFRHPESMDWFPQTRGNTNSSAPGHLGSSNLHDFNGRHGEMLRDCQRRQFDGDSQSSFLFQRNCEHPLEQRSFREYTPMTSTPVKERWERPRDPFSRTISSQEEFFSGNCPPAPPKWSTGDDFLIKPIPNLWREPPLRLDDNIFQSLTGFPQPPTWGDLGFLGALEEPLVASALRGEFNAAPGAGRGPRSTITPLGASSHLPLGSSH